jgi:dihydrofolate reductase
MRIVAMEWMSLDAVVQSPMYPDEDASGGFRHGGWHGPYLDEAAQDWVTETITSADAYLFGRGTYDRFAAYWPTAGPEVRVLAEPLNTRPKYVASHRPLTRPWPGAVRLGADVRDALPG